MTLAACIASFAIASLLWLLCGRRVRVFQAALTSLLILCSLRQLSQAWKAWRSGSSLVSENPLPAKDASPEAEASLPETKEEQNPDLLQHLHQGIGALFEMAEGTADTLESEYANLARQAGMETEIRAKTWRVALAAFNSDEFLSPDLLDNPSTLDRHRQMAYDYIEETKALSARLKESYAVLEAKLKELKPTTEDARSVLQEASKKRQELIDIIEPLMESHLDLGETMQRIVDYLKTHTGNWTIEEGEIKFRDREGNDRLEELSEEASIYRDRITELSERLNELEGMSL